MAQVGGHEIGDIVHGLGLYARNGLLRSHVKIPHYSFHETKNLECGEGGADPIRQEALVESAEILRGMEKTSVKFCLEKSTDIHRKM